MQPDERDASAAQWHSAQCHCGRVRFEFFSNIDAAVECNCSYCSRKAALHHRVPEDAFRLIEGEGALAEYRFGSLRARHYFCSTCGIHTHCRPRSAPEQVNVNLNCAVDRTLQPAHVRQYDGLSWQ